MCCWRNASSLGSTFSPLGPEPFAADSASTLLVSSVMALAKSSIDGTVPLAPMILMVSDLKWLSAAAAAAAVATETRLSGYESLMLFREKSRRPNNSTVAGSSSLGSSEV